MVKNKTAIKKKLRLKLDSKLEKIKIDKLDKKPKLDDKKSEDKEKTEDKAKNESHLEEVAEISEKPHFRQTPITSGATKPRESLPLESISQEGQTRKSEGKKYEKVSYQTADYVSEKKYTGNQEVQAPILRRAEVMNKEVFQVPRTVDITHWQEEKMGQRWVTPEREKEYHVATKKIKEDRNVWERTLAKDYN